MPRNLATILTLAALCCAVASSTPALAQTATPTTPAQTETPATPAQDANAPAAAADANAPGREFRFLSTNKVSTMEKELNELAAQGFRLERVSKSLVGDDMATLVSRDPSSAPATATPPNPADPRFEYKVLATRRAGTMDKEIAEAAAQGYEIRGMTSMFRPGIAIFIGDETAVVLERPAGETARRFDYKLLSTRREKTMQKELDEAIAAGFEPVEMVRGQDNGAASIILGPQFVNTIILGRRAGVTEASGAPREYKFLTTTKVGTMEREMNKAAKEGYRFHMSAPDMLMLMSRERGAAGPARYEYKLLATRKTGTMQKELLAQGASGYRYLATSNGLGGLAAVLERDTALGPKEGAREYKLLATSREKTTQKEISEALAGGYRILDLTTIGEFILVLDRQAGDTSAGVK
jgi:hypothetical protein